MKPTQVAEKRERKLTPDSAGLKNIAQRAARMANAAVCRATANSSSQRFAVRK